MSNVAKVAGAAANTLTTPLNVEDVFSTYLYEGNGTTKTITNGIDLDGEGGLVWIKNRDFSDNHMLLDTERGNEYLISNENFGEAGTGTSFVTTSTGFNIVGSSFDDWNASGENYASWTFRKAPKFFDCVTWTGDGVQGRSISHNLGSVPAVIITKKLNATDNWVVYHRSNGAGKMLYLNGTNSTLNSTAVYPTTPTDSVFYVGNDSAVNGTSSDTYVAYLFAHNDGDGEFGPNGDQDIIKCGSYAGSNHRSEEVVDVGFEPQWLLIKAANTDVTDAEWTITDNMRGASDVDGGWQLEPNSSEAESNRTSEGPVFRANGFYIKGADRDFNRAGSTYIYIAIRRGPMAVPESATDVFATETQGATTPNPPAFTSGFVVDAALFKQTNGATNWHLAPRLTQNKYMFTDTSDSEQTNSTYDFDFNNGWLDTTSAQSAYRSWMWKRAPNYFDVVCYKGNGSAGHTVSHNLGVAPEMMWVKRRNGTGSWAVYHAGIASDAETDYIYLDYNFSAGDDATFWNDTAPTASDFTLGNGGGVNSNNQTYIAYLFASLAGISKVGSYTGNNTSQTIDCGFSAGARFVIIKRTDFSGSWYLWDSARGIVAGNDPYLLLDTNAAEVSSYDWIDPDNSGFIVNSTTVNASSGNYIFYAIA